MVFLLAGLLLGACQEDENLEVASDLSGAWELISVSILENGQWTEWNDQDANLGTLFFEPWKDRNQNGKGYRELTDGTMAEFEFSVSGADKDYNPTVVNMSFDPTNDPAMEWQGVYDIVALSSVLTLERRGDDLIIKANQPE